MKTKKLILTFIMLMFLAAPLFSCSNAADNPGTADDTQTASGKEAPEADVSPLLPTEIRIDGKEISLADGKNEYAYGIPSGDPYIPTVEASADDGVEVKVIPGYIPYGENSGFARIILDDGERTNEIKIVFNKTSEKGFVLQYGDTYVFDCGENAVYTSSDPENVPVDGSTGKITVKKVVSGEVTVTAKTSEGEKTLVINEIKKARINLIFITGQSTAQGCYATSAWSADEKAAKVAEQHALIEQVEVEGAVYGVDLFPRSENTQVYKFKNHLYDMSKFPKQGYETSLGNQILYKTGEKTLFYQIAYSGAPIESWLDPARHEEAGTYGGHYFYTEMLSFYNKNLKKMLESNFEVIRASNFWTQGGTAMTAIYSKERGDYIKSSDPEFNKSDLITDETYYKYYMMIHNDMAEDFGIEYDFLMPSRATSGVASSKNRELGTYVDLVPIRCAHFALCNENKDIILISRINEIFRPATSADKESEGYAYVGDDKVHNNQIGYNALGRDIGSNIADHLYGDLKAESIELINTDGRTRLKEGETVALRTGGSKRIAAGVFPLAANEGLTWSSSNENVAKVDKFGNVKAVRKGTCRIIAKSESGLETYVTLSVID